MDADDADANAEVDDEDEDNEDDDDRRDAGRERCAATGIEGERNDLGVGA